MKNRAKLRARREAREARYKSPIHITPKLSPNLNLKMHLHIDLRIQDVRFKRILSNVVLLCDGATLNCRGLFNKLQPHSKCYLVAPGYSSRNQPWSLVSWN